MYSPILRLQFEKGQPAECGQLKANTSEQLNRISIVILDRLHGIAEEHAETSTGQTFATRALLEQLKLLLKLT